MRTLTLLFLFACSKAEDPSPLKLPEVETTSVEVTPSGVIVKGRVLSDGGSFVSSKGICWTDRAPLPPTITNNLAELTDTLQLAPGKYYFRAYARNGTGLAYGKMITVIR